MNKLIVSNGDDISDVIVTEDMYMRIDLSDTSQIINVDVMENQNLQVFDFSTNTSNKITYNLRSGATLIVNKLGINNSDTSSINLIGVNASVICNSSIINYEDNAFVQNINHLSRDTSCNVVNRGINVNDRSFSFIVNGNIKKDCTNCSSRQDNRIMNLKDGKSFIFPNLIVDNDSVNAFHSAYIGNFDLESIFYLKTRGLDDKQCNTLLIKGFLLGSMELDHSEKEVLLKMIENI